MILKVALIETAIELGLIPEGEARHVYADIQTLTAGEICGLINISPVPLDDPELIGTMERAIADNPRAVADYLAGKEKAINKIMGQLMRVSGGRNDAEAMLTAIKRRVDPSYQPSDETTETGLSAYDAEVLTDEKAVADYFEETLSSFGGLANRRMAKACCNWITGDLMARMNAEDFDFETRPKMIKRGCRAGCPIPPERLADLIRLVECGHISHGMAHQRVFCRMWTNAVEQVCRGS